MKILSISGSPRKGNSETILLHLQKLLKEKGIDNEIILLKDKSIERCHGCVEFCNHQHICRINDDMQEVIDKMVAADAYIFISPNYFQMPTGLMKDFMDRSNVIFYQDTDLKNKKIVVMSVGTDNPEMSEVCAQNIAKNYCRYIGKVVGIKSFQTHSELNGNYNDVFDSGLNPAIQQDLGKLVNLML